MLVKMAGEPPAARRSFLDGIGRAYLGKHRVRLMRRSPVILATGFATALLIVATGVVAAKIAQSPQGSVDILRVLWPYP